MGALCMQEITKLSKCIINGVFFFQTIISLSKNILLFFVIIQ